MIKTCTELLPPQKYYILSQKMKDNINMDSTIAGLCCMKHGSKTHQYLH